MKKQPTLLILAALLCACTSSLLAQNGQMRESVFEPGQQRPIYSIGAYVVMSGKQNYPIGINGEFKVMKVTSLFNPEAQQLSNSFITTTFGLFSVPEADGGFGFFDKHKTPTINIAYLMAGYRYYFGSFDYDQSNPWQWFLEGNLGLGMITYRNPAIAASAGAGFNLSKRLDGHVFYSGFYHNDKETKHIGGFSFGLSYKFR